MKTQNIKMNALDYFSDVRAYTLNIVRNLQMQSQRPETRRVITKKFSLEFQAHLLDMTPKYVRDLVKKGSLLSRKFIESGSFKFDQDEIYHNLDNRNMLPKVGKKPVVIAVSQYKGGVGKTTTATNLAVYLALSGYRVQVIDIDPQGTATEQLWKDSPIERNESGIKGLDGIKLEDTIYSLLSSKEEKQTKELKDIIIDTAWKNLKLIPSCVMLDSLNIEMSIDAAQRNKEAYWERFRNRINEFEGECDIIIIDSAPNINPLNLSALFAADILLMPLMAAMPDVSSFYQYVSHMESAISSMVNSRLMVKSRLPHFIPRVLISNYEGEIIEDKNPDMNKFAEVLNNMTAANKGLASKDTYIRTVLLKMLGKYLITSPILRSDAIKESANNFMPVFEIDTSFIGPNNKKRFTITDRTLKRSENSFIKLGTEIKKLIETLI